MKTVTVEEAEACLSELLTEVEAGEEVIITRQGKPVARLTAAAEQKRVQRTPGGWRASPGWRDFEFDRKLFAPMTDEEMREEGWPV